MTEPTFESSFSVDRKKLFLLAVACGITVANVYLSQPLLNEIALYFGAAPDHASLVASLAQIGYACGILFLVPCADSLSPRKLCSTLLIITAVMLGVCSFASGLNTLIIASFILTIFTVIPQIIIPFAVSVTPQKQTGKVIASLQTGVILGILLARTVSGLLADWLGTWRAPFIFASVLNFSVLIILLLCLPKFRKKSDPLTLKRYFELLKPMPGLIIKYPPLLLSCLMGFLLFGAFSAFWATLAYYLASPAFGMSPAQIGLFGVWGVLGALMAPKMGKISDRYGPTIVNLASIFALVSGFLLFRFPLSHPLLCLVIGVNLLDFGLQSGQIANQARIFSLPAEFRARLNTVYMVFNFAGGALGAIVGAYCWSVSGWNAVCSQGLILLLMAVLSLGYYSHKLRAF